MSWHGLPDQTVVFAPDGEIVDNETGLRWRDDGTGFEDGQRLLLADADWGQSGVVGNAKYQAEWVLDGYLTGQLEGEGSGFPDTVRYRMVAYRKGGARPVRFVDTFGIRVREKRSGRTIAYDESRGLPSNRVSSVWLSGDTAWVGMFDAGLCLVELTTGTVSRPTGCDEVPSDVSVLAERDGKLFVGTFKHGLHVLDVAESRAYHVTGVLSKRVNCMIVSGGDLWVGTDDGISLVRASSGS